MLSSERKRELRIFQEEVTDLLVNRRTFGPFLEDGLEDGLEDD